MNLIYDFCKEEYGVNMQEEWEEMKTEEEKYKPEKKVVVNMRFFDILSKRVQGILLYWLRS